MKRDYDFKFDTSVIALPLFFVLFIWLVYWFEIRFGYDFTSYGVYPRTFKGLRGVLFSPFIHSSIEHLYNNTIPSFVMLMAVRYFYRDITIKVIVIGIIASGVLTWLIGRPSYHIGASGLIYALVSFVFFKGVITRYFRLVALSLIVVFLYGGFLWYLFPIEDGISWEGHLSGFVVGLLMALFIKRSIPLATKYKWEEDGYQEDNDPFLRHFDEHGNFIPSSELDKDVDSNTHTFEAGTRIHYHYTRKKEIGEDDQL
ncbi:rhomboid family intramembrane serine protease [Zhouia amylolytica]|uniref:Peptidase S54, rhomboid domain-containing protein n=1 Tax=Zhouia amylolytica AD3 TaxID=1286632 RepID=W2UT91_9FLAO|nr:rhomboid family intramembrane serine protease [Zhouia amylolytica]ETN96721.1 peptidase S54, rhomboid domain-containing protein [Zhouia amylolytica AD3]